MSQGELFGGPIKWNEANGIPPMRDASICLYHDFIPPKAATELLEHLIEHVPWRQDRITIFGRPRLVPRLHQWFADEGRSYKWSGILMKATPWTSELTRIREAVSEKAGAAFNSVLVNYYRDGGDMVSWHSDDEEELGENPVIASVSLGAERDFKLRHKKIELPVVQVPLPHGSLLVMEGPTQEYWQHSLPRRKGVTKPRVNLTFRETKENRGPAP